MKIHQFLNINNWRLYNHTSFNNIIFREIGYFKGHLYFYKPIKYFINDFRDEYYHLSQLTNQLEKKHHKQFKYIKSCLFANGIVLICHNNIIATYHQFYRQIDICIDIYFDIQTYKRDQYKFESIKDIFKWKSECIINGNKSTKRYVKYKAD